MDIEGQKTKPEDVMEAVVRRLTWRLVPFLFLLYIVAYLDRINVGFAALQMQRQLGFTDAVYGLGAGTLRAAGYDADFESVPRCASPVTLTRGPVPGWE